MSLQKQSQCFKLLAKCSLYYSFVIFPDANMDPLGELWKEATENYILVLFLLIAFILMNYGDVSLHMVLGCHPVC